MASGGAATATLSRCSAGSPRDSEEMNSGEGSALHDRLVAYVHTLAHGSRRGVWGEHSYARARIGSARAGSPPRVRALLEPRPRSPAPALVDVVSAPSPPSSPPALSPLPTDDDDDTDAEEGDWEERVSENAPSAAHARLADACAETLREMRLVRLASEGRAARREAARAAARRLRRALAPLWTGSAPAWLHAHWVQHLPRAERILYDEVVAELHRSVPRLAARLRGVRAPPATLPTAAPAVGPESSPWLVWVSSGCAALDARWEPHLSALVHTRVLRGAGGAPGQEAAPPEQWCAAAAASVRSALTDALAEAGSRAVILGGVGCGGAVALVLARGAGGAGRAEGGVRGAALVAPPLSTAEGARASADDALAACRLPLLLVCGTRAAQCARHAALAVQHAAPRAAPRRLLEVRGADDELRVPARRRARLRLPQRALDAALVEEVVRWAVETAEQEEPPPSPPAAERPRIRPVLSTVIREIDLTAEYSHLPAAPPALSAPAPGTPAPNASIPTSALSQNSRSLDVEGRVVSRVCGGTPLPLLAPRRPGSGPAVGAALAVADIMQLPIVFADDEPAAPCDAPHDASPAASLADTPVTVTSGKPIKRGASALVSGSGAGGAGGSSADSGSVKFTRVILAKRGARGAAGGGGGPAPRRLLVRRGVRLVPAHRP